MFYSNIFAFICLPFANNHYATVRQDIFKSYKHKKLKFLIFTKLLKLQRNVIFISKKCFSEYKSKVTSSSYISYLYNPVESKIESNDLLKKIVNTVNLKSLSDCNFTILSRIVHGKGIFSFLNQFKDFIINNNINIKIYGDGDKAHLLNDVIVDLNLSHNVNYHGYSYNVNDNLANTDILIFPSESEGFGRIAFEAALNGVFVLWNRKSSLKEDFNYCNMFFDYTDESCFLKAFALITKLNSHYLVNQISCLRSELSIRQHTYNFLRIVHHDCN